MELTYRYGGVEVAIITQPISFRTPSLEFDEIEIPPSIVNSDFLALLRSLGVPFSAAKLHRLNRSHGQTLHDILALRKGELQRRIPDVVVWPRSGEDVEKVWFTGQSHLARNVKESRQLSGVGRCSPA